jgi:inosose dehydratase
VTDDRRVRLGAELITFFNTEYWGLPAHMDYGDWIDAFLKDPRGNYDRMLDGAVETGVEGIELPPDPGGWTTAELAYGSAKAFRRELDARGLAVGSSYENSAGTVVPALSDPAAEAAADERLAAHARFLSELDADTIVMGTLSRSNFAGGWDGEVPLADMERVAAQYNRLGQVVKPFGVKIAIHTDSYSVCSRPQDIRTFLSLTDPETVQLCPDAGHITLDGGDAADILAEHVDRVPVMHWKDCVGHLHPGGLPTETMVRHEIQLTWFRVIGDGIVDWKRWQTILRDAGWSGWAMAEIDMSPDPIGEIRQALSYYAGALAPIYQ